MGGGFRLEGRGWGSVGGPPSRGSAGWPAAFGCARRGGAGKWLTGTRAVAQTRNMARNAATLSLAIPLPPRQILDSRLSERPADDDPLRRARALPSVSMLAGATVSLRDLTAADLRPA